MKKSNKFILVFVFILLVSSLCYKPVYADDNIENNENAKKLYAHILSKGGTDWWAATAVGNAYAELRLKTDLEISSNGHFGAFQFSKNNKSSFENWCKDNNRDELDICTQYDYFMEKYRGDCCKGLTGFSPSELEKDTSVIVDAESAAAYFALGMEGCVCWSSITKGSGSLNSGHNHDDSSCTSFTFTTKYGEVQLQHLSKRVKNTETAYNAFSGKVAPQSGGSSSSSGSNESEQQSSQIENLSIGGGYYSEEQLSSFMQLYEQNIQSEYIDNAKRENLSQDNLVGLNNWERNIQNNKRESGFIATLRMLTMLFGIFFIIWILFIYIAYWFDRLNTIVYIDALSLLTFGRLHISDTEEECTFSVKTLGKTEKKTVNHKAILSICITGIFFSTLILTGTFYKIVASFINFVLRLIGR